MDNLNYKSNKSLKKVKDIIAEADEALKDQTRTKPKYVAGLSGLAAAVIVAGTALASIPAAPLVIIGGTIAGINAAEKRRKLNEEKERLYNLALQKHQAMINELKEQQVASKERIEYLESINVLLQESIVKLREDLDNARSIQV